MTPLAGWQNFYVIVGSSAGALIGLQFVVMALVADMPRTPVQAQAGHAFATPTIIHFGAVLMLSAALSAPWQNIGGAAVLWGLMGLGGVAYAIIVASLLSDGGLDAANHNRASGGGRRMFLTSPLIEQALHPQPRITVRMMTSLSS